MAEEGLFISFEGIGGSGKSSVCKRVSAMLESVLPGKFLITREPGGTPHAEYLRDLLRGGFPGLKDQQLDPMAVALLFNVARQDHVAKLIKPAVAEGKLVVTDRYCDTTFTYQHVYNGIPLEKLRELHDVAIGMYPSITFLMDCPAIVAAERVSEGEKSADMFDSATLHMQEQMRQTYLKLARDEPLRYKVIDASRAAEDVLSEVLNYLRAIITVWKS